MQEDPHALNPHLSADCVIFGFNGTQLKVLLIERTTESGRDYKLPGDFIYDTEDTGHAAHRILHELTGLKDLYLQQFAVFGSPHRVAGVKNLAWFRATTGLDIYRVVTTAYFSLVRLERSNKKNALLAGASWHPADQLPALAFDHREIIYEGLRALRREIRFQPIGFELLPGKFTIRQIQNLYEAILGHPLDNRNFRKKLLKAPYVEPLEEKEQGVAHKPARYYRFDREKYEHNLSESNEYNF